MTRERRAITPADVLHATRLHFRRRVDAARALIEQAQEHGTIGVSYSAGKDSTVMLDLVRRVVPDAPVAFFDSGAEYEWTYDLVREMGVTTITPEMSIVELARYARAWGYRDPSGETEYRPVDYDAFLIHEPAQRFRQMYGVTVDAIGLRGDESWGRRMNALKRGEMYYAKGDKCWHLCPVMWWTTDDIWAYIASRGLAYNTAYDRMAAFGLPRERWRVSTLLSFEAAATGHRFSILRQIDRPRFDRLASEFPDLLRYS